MGFRRSIKVNLAASWLSHAICIGIGIFLMPYVLAVVGDEAYGTWLMIHAVAGYGGFLYLGFGQSICRYVADYYERERWDEINQVVNVMFFVYLGMGALGFLIAASIAWLAPNLNDWGGQSTTEIQLVILILGLEFFLGMATSVFGGVLIGIERFDLERGLQCIAGISRLILTVILLSQRSSLLTLSLIYLTVTLIEHVGHLILAFRNLPSLSIGWRHFRLSTLKEFAAFSSYAWLNMVSAQLIEYTDTIIIGCVLGAKATIPYHIAQRLCKFISTPILQIGEVLLPRAGVLNATSHNSELQRLVTRGVGVSVLLITAFFIGGSFFGSMLITIWIGPGYPQSHILLILLLGAQIIATPISVVRSVLFGMGHVKRQSILYIIEAVSNVVLSLILIGPFGLLGVAMGTIIPVIVIQIGFLAPYALRIFQLKTGDVVRWALGPQVLALSGLLAYSLAIQRLFSVTDTWLNLITITIGGGAVLGVGWLSSSALDRRYRFLEYSESAAVG